MSTTRDEEPCGDRRGPDQARNRARFADYVQVHSLDGKVITRADEKRILQEGLTRFDLDFREAQGILLSVASEQDVPLISHVEHHVGNYLQLVVKRKKVSRKDFNKAVQLYRKMTGDSVPEPEVRARVKQMIESEGWTGKRRRLLLGSRRWFRRSGGPGSRRLLRKTENA